MQKYIYAKIYLHRNVVKKKKKVTKSFSDIVIHFLNYISLHYFLVFSLSPSPVFKRSSNHRSRLAVHFPVLHHGDAYPLSPSQTVSPLLPYLLSLILAHTITWCTYLYIHKNFSATAASTALHTPQAGGGPYRLVPFLLMSPVNRRVQLNSAAATIWGAGF